MGRLGGWRTKLRIAGAAVLATAAVATIGPSSPPAAADATKPPPFPADCPPGQAPPPGYGYTAKGMTVPTKPWTYPVANPQFSTLGHVVPNKNFSTWDAPSPDEGGQDIPITVGKRYGPGPIAYLAPFKGIIAGGSITFDHSNSNTPTVMIPHLYASVCGRAQVPELTGSLLPSGIDLATPNVYVGTGPATAAGFKALEAIPVTATFGTAAHPLQANILPTPAPNGGIDALLKGTANAAVTELGLTCSLTLQADFSTMAGEAVTGPPTDGYAIVEAKDIPVPPLQPSPTCPAVIASTFNKLLGLGQDPHHPDGAASLIAPFCFDFELDGLFTATPTALCPWPT